MLPPSDDLPTFLRKKLFKSVNKHLESRSKFLSCGRFDPCSAVNGKQ